MSFCPRVDPSRKVNSLPERIKKTFVTFLALAVIVQFWTLLVPASRDLNDVWKTIGQPAYWRSANFGQNQRFADYIFFLKTNIPEDSLVVLPPGGIGPRVASHVAYMQYFLEPREVINCTQLACLANWAKSDSYILVFGPEQFTQELNSIKQNRLLTFDEQWGILLPDGGSRLASTVAPRVFSRIEEITALMVLPVSWLVLLVGIGFSLATALIPRWGILSRISIGYGLALGSASFMLYLAMLLSLRLTSELVLFLAAFMLLGSLFLLRSIKKRNPRTKVVNPGVQTTFDIWHIAFLLLGLLALGLSVGQSYHATDGIVLWAAKGYGIANSGLASGLTEWGTNTAKYPLNIILTISTFKEMFGELLPASKLIYPGFYLALLFISYEYLLPKMDRTIAGLAVFFLGTVPLLFEHATLGATNLPLAYYQVAALILVSPSLNARKGKGTMQQRPLLLAGIFFALAAWTRPEGLLVSAIFAFAIVAIGFWRWQKPRRWRYSVCLLAPILVYALIWETTSSFVYTLPTNSEGALSTGLLRIIQGDFKPDAILQVLRFSLSSAFKFNTWGLLGPGAVLLFLASLSLGRRSGPALGFIATGLLGIFLIMGAMYFVAFAPLPTCDLSCMLSNAFDRFSLSGVALLWLGLIEKLFAD